MGKRSKLPAGPIVLSTRGDSGCFLNKEIASTLVKVDSMSDDNTIEHIDSHKGQRLLHSTRPMVTTWVGVQQDDLHDTLQKCSTTSRFRDIASPELYKGFFMPIVSRSPFQKLCVRNHVS